MAPVWLPLALLHDIAEDCCKSRVRVVGGIVMAEFDRIFRQWDHHELNKVDMGTYVRCFILDERRKHVAL